MAGSSGDPGKVVVDKTMEQLGAMEIEHVIGKVAGKAAGKVAGVFVEPALWVIKGEPPDSVDVGLWGVGIVGGPIGTAAAFMTGVIKGLVDDAIKAQLEAVRSGEPVLYRKFIKPTIKYGIGGAFVNALTIGSKGGTAWMHPNGLWVYITDAKNRLIPDYKPAKAKNIMQPILPLVKSGDGFKFTSK